MLFERVSTLPDVRPPVDVDACRWERTRRNLHLGWWTPPPVAGGVATTYYVRATGNDSNAGTSAGAAWLTVQKALNTVAAGDTVWFGAGTYRQVLNCKTAGTAGNVITLNGDVDGVKTGDPGDVVFSGWTTNDTTAPSGTALFDFSNAGSNFGTFYAVNNIQFFSGADCVRNTSGTVHDLTFTNCGFYTGASSGQCVRFILPADTFSNILLDRCYALGSSNTNMVSVTMTKSATAAYDAGWEVRNCVFLPASGCTVISLINTGANTKLPGGGLVSQCSVFGGSVFVNTNAQTAWQFPVRVIGCAQWAGVGPSLQNNGTNGLIVEDWNLLDSLTARASSLVAGPNSKSGQGTTYAPLWEMFADAVVGRSTRNFMEPRAGSPLLGFVPQGTQISCGVPGTAADDATVGTIAWTSPGNATALDATNATDVITASATGHYLKVTNFTFTPAIPVGATITQVTVQLYASKSGSGTLAANSIKLTKNGTTFPGNDNSATLPASTLTASIAEYQVGGSNDLWGLTLSQSDVAASTFGVGISWKNTSGAQSITPAVDYVRIYVEYTTTPPPSEHSVDFRNRLRPAGGSVSIAVGAMDRGSTAAKETSTTHTGSNAIKLAGPSYQDFQLAVDASSTVISAYMRYDGSYGGSTLPTMQVVNGTECGVADASISQVGASNTWEQVSLTIVPTAKGVVTVRFSNLSTAAAGNVYVDTFAVA